MSLGPAPVVPKDICRKTVFRSFGYIVKYKYISIYICIYTVYIYLNLYLHRWPTDWFEAVRKLFGTFAERLLEQVIGVRWCTPATQKPCTENVSKRPASTVGRKTGRSKCGTLWCDLMLKWWTSLSPTCRKTEPVVRHRASVLSTQHTAGRTQKTRTRQHHLKAKARSSKG